MDLPSIQRRTDKKLPRYFDSNDMKNIKNEDSFMFLCVEELVPLLFTEGGTLKVKQTTEGDFTIRQYRPRIEGGFSRIERIHQKGNGFYWRVTSHDNIQRFLVVLKRAVLPTRMMIQKSFNGCPNLVLTTKVLMFYMSIKKKIWRMSSMMSMKKIGSMSINFSQIGI